MAGGGRPVRNRVSAYVSHTRLGSPAFYLALSPATHSSFQASRWPEKRTVVLPASVRAPRPRRHSMVTLSSPHCSLCALILAGGFAAEAQGRVPKKTANVQDQPASTTKTKTKPLPTAAKASARPSKASSASRAPPDNGSLFFFHSSLS